MTHVLPPKGRGRSSKKHIDLQWCVWTRDSFPSSVSYSHFLLKIFISFPSYFLRALHSLCPSPGSKRNTQGKCFWVEPAWPKPAESPLLSPRVSGVRERDHKNTCYSDAITSYWWKTACLGGKPFSQTVICLGVAMTLCFCAKNINQAKSPSPMKGRWDPGRAHPRICNPCVWC